MSAIDRGSSLWGRALLAAAIACSAACQTKTAAPSVAAQAPAAGTPAQNLVNAYLSVQNKLAADDLGGAKAAFASVQTAAQPSELALDDALRQRIARAAAEGVAAADVASARTAFSALSEGVLSWFGSSTNPLATPLTVAHCPMALEGKGSKWLQLGDKLRNPYFGSEMLSCGDVEGTLKPGAKL